MDSIQIGLQLTLYGMGIVFLLLGVLAFVVWLIARLDRAEPATENAPAEEPGIDPDLLAAMMIAIARHRAALRRVAAPAMRQHQPGTLPSRWVGIGRVQQNHTWQPARRNK
jgi:glutaconyl-CoA/methylmalonyl-CoA decarboxylase subunit delta